MSLSVIHVFGYRDVAIILNGNSWSRGCKYWFYVMI